MICGDGTQGETWWYVTPWLWSTPRRQAEKQIPSLAIHQIFVILC